MALVFLHSFAGAAMNGMVFLHSFAGAAMNGMVFLHSFAGAAMNCGCTGALHSFKSACAINRAAFLDKIIKFRYNLLPDFRINE